MRGIGGRTIAEAKERMSMDEYATWCQYRQRHGSFDLGPRIEQGAALVAWMVNRGHGELADYLPQRTPDEADEVAALDKAMKEWR